MPPATGLSIQDVLGVGLFDMQAAGAGTAGGGGFGDPLLKQIHNELKTHTKLLTEIRDALRKATGATAGGVGAGGALGGGLADLWRGGGLMAMGGRAGALGRFGAFGLGAAGGWYGSGMAETNWGRLGAGVAGGALSGGLMGLATGGLPGAAVGGGLGALGGAASAAFRWETKTEEATAKGVTKGFAQLVRDNKTGATMGAMAGIGGGVSSMFMGAMGGALGQQVGRQMGGTAGAEIIGGTLGPGLFAQYAGMAQGYFQQALAYRGAVAQARLAGGGGVFGAQGARYFGPTALAGMAPGMVQAGGNVPGMTRETAGLALMMQLTRNVGVGETMGAAGGMLMRGGAAGLNAGAQNQVLKSLLADAVSAGFERQIGRYGAAVGQAMDEATHGLVTTSDSALGATEEMGEAIRQLTRRYDIRPENAAQIAASGRAMFGGFSQFMQTGVGMSPYAGAMMYRTLARPGEDLAARAGLAGAPMAGAAALGAVLAQPGRGGYRALQNILGGNLSPTIDLNALRNQAYGMIQSQMRTRGGDPAMAMFREFFPNIRDAGMQLGLAGRIMRGREPIEAVLGDIQKASRDDVTTLRDFAATTESQLDSLGGPLGAIAGFERQQLGIATDMLGLSKSLVQLQLQTTAAITATYKAGGGKGLEDTINALSRSLGNISRGKTGTMQDIIGEIARGLGMGGGFQPSTSALMQRNQRAVDWLETRGRSWLGRHSPYETPPGSDRPSGPAGPAGPAGPKYVGPPVYIRVRIPGHASRSR